MPLNSGRSKLPEVLSDQLDLSSNILAWNMALPVSDSRAFIGSEVDEAYSKEEIILSCMNDSDVENSNRLSATDCDLQDNDRSFVRDYDGQGDDHSSETVSVLPHCLLQDNDHSSVKDCGLQDNDHSSVKDCGLPLYECPGNDHSSVNDCDLPHYNEQGNDPSTANDCDLAAYDIQRRYCPSTKSFESLDECQNDGPAAAVTGCNSLRDEQQGTDTSLVRHSHPEKPQFSNSAPPSDPEAVFVSEHTSNGPLSIKHSDVTTMMPSLSRSSSTGCLSVALSDASIPSSGTGCEVNGVSCCQDRKASESKPSASASNSDSEASGPDVLERDVTFPNVEDDRGSGKTECDDSHLATPDAMPITFHTLSPDSVDSSKTSLKESCQSVSGISEISSSAKHPEVSDAVDDVDLSYEDVSTVGNSNNIVPAKETNIKTGDQIVDSILIDDEEANNIILRKKESRPNSIRLSAMSLGTQGSSTPIGNFGSIGDDVDLDDAQFVEINLQSCNTDSRSSANDHSPSAESGSTLGVMSKTLRLGNFLTRNFSLKKPRDREEEEPSNDLGWKLFGRVPPKQAGQTGLPEILNEYKAKLTSKPPVEKDLVRRSDKEVPSTTALILQPRQRGLPTKDPEEDLKHKMMYVEMVEAARKSEQREAKLRKKQREQQIRYEEELSAAVRIWNAEILPNWETLKSSRKTQDLWWKGIPPSIRGKVWKLAIGNDLNVTSELYDICVMRATEKLKILRDVFVGSDTDSVSSFTTEATGNRESSVDLIKLDVSRTFPQLGIFQAGGPYHNLLQGLLGAYVCYRPDVGYVQGMSFLAAVLLLNMDDVSSFICFANLLNKPCEVAFFRLDENLMKAYFDTYQVFFRENLPKLYAHFEAQHITPDLYIIDWMYTLFAKSLPLDVASRVWDVFCRDGEEFLFRTALGILRLYEDILLHLDFIHIAQFLTRLPENLSASELFQCIGQIRMQASKCSFVQVLARNQCP